jgi:hypothetical protein
MAIYPSPTAYAMFVPTPPSLDPFCWLPFGLTMPDFIRVHGPELLIYQICTSTRVRVPSVSPRCQNRHCLSTRSKLILFQRFSTMFQYGKDTIQHMPSPPGCNPYLQDVSTAKTWQWLGHRRQISHLQCQILAVGQVKKLRINDPPLNCCHRLHSLSQPRRLHKLALI